MSISTCWSCRSLLRQRLRAHISLLQQSRRCASTNAKPSLSWYNDTTAPTSTQLEAAENFFLTHKPRKLWTATEWRRHNDAESTSLGLIPEVAFLGRSNVGKSSLLNALLLSPALNHVGPRPGKTTTMHAWAVSPTDPKTGGAIRGMKGDMDTKCAVLDMPGYGHASHDDWGEEIMSYLKNRKQLKRAFVLVDGRHGLKSGDLTMLRLLRKQGVSAQVVVSKCDKVGKIEGEEVVKKLWNVVQEKVKGPGLGLLGEVLVVGSLGDGRKNDKVHYNDMRGVHEVQWAVLRATGLDEYAINAVSQASKSANTSMQQTKSEEGLQVETKKGALASISPKLHNLPTQSQHTTQTQPQSQPQPEASFSWPAKIRKPTSGIPESASKPQSPSLTAMKPMNAPAPSSEIPSTFLGQGFEDPLSMVPQRLPINNGVSVERKTSVEAFNAPFQRTIQKLVPNGMLSLKGRQVMDYREEDVSPAAERDVARKPSGTSAAWTGSAVGGMADLQAISSRTARGGRKPVKTNPRMNGRHSVQYTEESSQDVLAKLDKPKEAWRGSAVGGMADLEEMMARTSGPARGGGRPAKKPLKRKRHR